MSVKIDSYPVDDLAYRKDPDTEERADATIQFAVGGALYEIDLTAKNAASFHRKLEPYMQAGRRLKAKRSRPAAVRRHSGDIRAWAKARGIEVSARGRIPRSVIEQYEQAAGHQVA